MDPNSWSNYNQHYGKLAHNRYDMPLLDQQGLNSGLGSLSSPLSPPHTALPTARPLGSLTPMSYSHPLHNMSQFLDTVNPLQAGYTSQPPYKGMQVGQTGLPMDTFLASHVHHEPAVSMSVPSSCYLPPSSLTSPEIKPMFLSELPTRDLSNSYPSTLSSHNTPSVNSGSEAKNWGLSNFLPANSAGLGDIGSYSLGHYAGSLSRHASEPSNQSMRRSNSLRDSYPSDLAYSSGLPKLSSVAPIKPLHDTSSTSPLGQNHSAHVAHMSLENQRVEMRRLQELEDLSRVPHAEPGNADMSRLHSSQIKTARSQGHNVASRETSKPNLKMPSHTYKTSPSPKKPKPSENNLYGHYGEDPSVKSHGTNSSRTTSTTMADMNYDPISPVPPAAEHRYNDNLSTISLQDLGSISSDNLYVAKLEVRGKQESQKLESLSQEKGKKKKAKEQPKKRRSKNKASASSNTSDQVQVSSKEMLEMQGSLQQPSSVPQNYATPQCSPGHPHYQTQQHSSHVQPQSPHVQVQLPGQETLFQIKPENQHYQQTSPQTHHQSQHLQQMSPQTHHQSRHFQQTSPQIQHDGQNFQQTSTQIQHESQHLQQMSPQTHQQSQHFQQTSPQLQHQSQHLLQMSPQMHHQSQHFQQTSQQIQHQSQHLQQMSPHTHQQSQHLQQMSPQMYHESKRFQQISPQIQHQDQNLQQTSPQAQHQNQYLPQSSPQAQHQSHHLQQTSPQMQHQNQYLQQSSPKLPHQNQHSRQMSPQRGHQNQQSRKTSPQIQHKNQYFQQTSSHIQETSPHMHLPDRIKQETSSPVRHQSQIKQEHFQYSQHQDQFAGQLQQETAPQPSHNQNPPFLSSDVQYSQHTQLSNAQVNNEHMQHEFLHGQWQPIKFEQQSPHKQPESKYEPLESRYEQQDSQCEHQESYMHQSHGQVGHQSQLKQEHCDTVKQEVTQHHGSLHPRESDNSAQTYPPYYQVSGSPFRPAADSVSAPTGGSAPDTCHSTVIHSAPPTIQAVADSTTVTKPRKSKGRKKKQQAPLEAKENKHTPNILQDNKLRPEDACHVSKSQEEQTSPWLDTLKFHPADMTQELKTQDLHTASGLKEPIAASVISLNKEGNVEEQFVDRQLKREFFESKPVLDPDTVGFKCEDTLNRHGQNGNEFELTVADSANLSHKDTEMVSDGFEMKNIALKQEADCDVSGEQVQKAEGKKEMEKLPAVVTSELEFDEDFQHLAPTPVKITKIQNPSQSSPPKLSSSGSQAFLGSFVNFLCGKKGETLSSVTQSPVKRPPMPKYIPELRKVKPAPAVSLSQEESQENSSSISPSQKESTISVSQNVSESRKGKRKAKEVGQGSSRKGKKSKLSTDVPPSDGPEEDESSPHMQDSDIPEQAAPVRRQSSRQAKERLSGNKRSYAEDESEDETKNEEDDDLEEVTYTTDEEVDYDSDKDPAWTPFAAEKKQTPVVLPLRKRRITGPATGKNKAKSFGQAPKFKKVKKAVRPVRPPSDSDQDSDSQEDGGGEEEDEEEQSPSPEPQQSPSPPSAATDTATGTITPSAVNIVTPAKSNTPPKEYQRGTFLIEKRDLTNYENFPVWRVSDGKMLQKYELIIEKGQVKHKSTFTYSSWTPWMHDQFQPVKVNIISRDKRQETIIVDESDRPKPPTDGSLERRYEDDPMVESFNVFLQILLSQALEPGFLKAIHVSEDDFYLGHMNKVDQMIQARISKIQKKVKWNKNFKEAVKNRPHVRELDRPNLTQNCQACRDIRQTAIKSVHLFGDPYDIEDLSDQPNTTTSSSEEFLIGKTATTYLMTYHSLVHYKYNLYKRCVAKVNLVKESEETEDNASVLDACLHNRAWVLKLFEDLKKLLEKP